MFLRTKITPTGFVLQLVASYRDAEQRPRQRILASLGDVSVPEHLRSIIVHGVEARLSGQVDLTLDGTSAEAATWIDRIVRQCDRRVSVAHVQPPTTPIPALPAAEEVVSPAPVAEGPVAVAAAGDVVIDGVRAAQVTHQDTAVFGSGAGGAACVGVAADACLTQLGFPVSQQQAIAVEVINRLVEPLHDAQPRRRRLPSPQERPRPAPHAPSAH
jgi:hypothetical protein